MRGIAATYVELLRDTRFVILVLVAALGMSGLFAYIAGASFVLQGTYGLDQQAFALVFGAGAVALIGATQFNVVLLKRFSPQSITLWALAAALLAGGALRRPVGGARRWPGRRSSCRYGQSWPRWAWSFPTRLRSRCPGIPTPRVPPPRCLAPPSSVSAPRSPRSSGVLGNDELALSIVMTAGVLIALMALLAVGVSASDDADEGIPEGAVAEPA